MLQTILIVALFVLGTPLFIIFVKIIWQAYGLSKKQDYLYFSGVQRIYSESRWNFDQTDTIKLYAVYQQGMIFRRCVQTETWGIKSGKYWYSANWYESHYLENGYLYKDNEKGKPIELYYDSVPA